MKTTDEVYVGINDRFKSYTKKGITEGSVIDLYTVALSDTMGEVYKDIENIKNPHIYSKLKGQSLDDLGFFHNMPREAGEGDEQYKYRLMDWKLSSEASNLTAINNALLRTVYSSNSEYIPLTNGSGTASVYIIPVTYEEEVIKKAVEEAMDIVSKIVSPSIFVEYVVPDVKKVLVHAYLSSEDGDLDLIKANITTKIREYVNSVPPNKSLEIGYINKLGVTEEQVNYFNVLQLFIDDKETDEIEVMQGLTTKFILDEIIWS